jgi:exopolysaccharide production protein ExoY
MPARNSAIEIQDTRQSVTPVRATALVGDFTAVSAKAHGQASRDGRPGRALYMKIDGCAKRAMDIIFAAIILTVCSPLMALVAFLVMIDGGPVLFKHNRVGRQLRSFHCLKFRTMISGAEPCLSEYLAHHPQARAEWEFEQKLEADPRVTAIGRLLRRSSLDELPQLFNVLAGDMSLVGPRPITNDEVIRYGSYANLYASVRPGLTGPWQVSGRNNTSYAERVNLDAQYALDHNVLQDFLILKATPRAVLCRRGAK